MSMKNKQASHRQSMPAVAAEAAPAPAVPAEKTPTKLTLRQRAIASARSAGRAIKSAAQAVKTIVKTIVAKVRPSTTTDKIRADVRAYRLVARAAHAGKRAIVSTARKTSPGVRAFVRVWAVTVAVGVWLGVLAVAPELCILLTVCAGFLLMGLAHLVEFADAHGGRVRWFVDVLDRALWVAGWTLLALITAAFVTTSLVDAALFFLMAAFWIAYRWPVEADKAAVARMYADLESVRTIDADAPSQESLLRQADEETLVQAINLSCVACGAADGAMRINGWCKACFEALEEDFSKRLDKHRNSMMRLEPTDQLNHLHAVRASRADAEHVYWAEVAWWVDRHGVAHPRSWAGFLQGSAIAHVEYDHHKDKNARVFRAFLKEVQIGTYWKIETAKGAIVDQMVDIGMMLASAMRSAAGATWDDEPVRGGQVLDMAGVHT